MHLLIRSDEFVLKLKQGHVDHFRKFYDFYFQRTYNSAYNLLKDAESTEDVVQDVFVQLWESKHKFQEGTDLWFYIYVLTRNACINKLREIQKDKKLVSALFITMQAQSTQAQDIAHEDQLLEKFTLAKASLTPQQRLVFELCREQGLTYQQAAEQLNISKNTVKNHMIAALRIFKTQLLRDVIYLIFLLFAFFKN